MQWLRRSFIAGFFVTVPLFVSVAAIIWIFGVVDGATTPIYDQLIGRRIPGLGLVSTAIAIILVGAFARNVIGRRILTRTEGWLLKVPLFRTIYFAPVVTTVVAVAVVWKYLYHPKFGLFNRGLELLHIPPIDFLGDPHWAMPAIILLSIWKNFGYTMIIFVAALQAIPEELYEAARIDGANAIQQFRHVTLPMLGPTFVFVGIITAIGFLQLFPEPYVMTGGGPVNATLSVVMLMYEQGFKFWKMGYAAAVAFLLFLVIGLATLLQLKAQKARV